jgi:hypothetical protein
MKKQSRNTILKIIEKYLRNNLKDTQGVRSLSEDDRIKGLIKRLDEFSPIETLHWNIPDRKLFREAAVAAGIQFVREYPMLYHTPNSLRACFGMPTRTDRKKGRFSSIYFRNEAVERQLRPRIKDLDNLKTKINKNKDEKFTKQISKMNDYIERAKRRNYVDEILDTPESDHSEKSIKDLKDFLKGYGFKNLKEAAGVAEDNEEHLQDLNGIILAPDLIGSWKGKECWIELKEYREQQFNSKVVFQIFRYLLQNPFVILISTIKLLSFEQIKELRNLNKSKLQDWGLEQQEQIQKELTEWSEKRRTYKELGKSLKLNSRLETLMLTITNEIVTRELGLIGAEMRGIEKFIEITNNFDDEIIVQDFDVFMQDQKEPYSQPCLLLKTDYQKEEDN